MLICIWIPQDLVKMQIWVQWFLGETQDFSLPSSSQAVLRLHTQDPPSLSRRKINATSLSGVNRTELGISSGIWLHPGYSFLQHKGRNQRVETPLGKGRVFQGGMGGGGGSPYWGTVRRGLCGGNGESEEQGRKEGGRGTGVGVSMGSTSSTRTFPRLKSVVLPSMASQCSSEIYRERLFLQHGSATLSYTWPFTEGFFTSSIVNLLLPYMFQLHTMGCHLMVYHSLSIPLFPALGRYIECIAFLVISRWQ